MSTNLTEKEMKDTLLRHFSCSESMLTLLNRMAETEMKELEEASDPLCGGILLTGHDVCGIAWGATLAAGIRAKNKFSSDGEAAWYSLTAAQKLVEAFESDEESIECASRIGMDKWNMTKYMMKGNTAKCQESLAKWAPRFHEIIESNLNNSESSPNQDIKGNCSCEVMGKVSEQLGYDLKWYVPVAAGFAGGLGLSGNACGALTAAILSQMLNYFMKRDKPKHGQMRSIMQGFNIGTGWMKPSQTLLKEFTRMYGTKSCRGITQRQFSSPEELSAFVKSGGCSDVIENVVTWTGAA